MTTDAIVLLAAAIHAVTSERRTPPVHDRMQRLDVHTGVELLGWAASAYPTLLAHLTGEQLADVSLVLDGMLRERAHRAGDA